MFFIQDMISKEVRIRELTLHAEKLKVEHYTEYEMIREMIEVRNIVCLENCKLRIIEQGEQTDCPVDWLIN